MLTQNKEELDAKVRRVNEINSRGTHCDAECQTEIHSAISCKIDLVIMHENPFKVQGVKVP